MWVWRAAVAAAERWGGRGLAVIAPRHCAGCDQAAAGPVCTACRGRLGALDEPPPLIGERGVVRAAFAYEEPVRSILRRAKYADARSALDAVADVAAARYRCAPWQRPGGLVAIPLGPRRLRERGFNQADVFVRALGERLGLPVWGGLERARETPPQVGHDEAWRRANVAGAFAWRGERLRSPVWIVDDVHTTGATTGAAAAVLRRAGAPWVDVAVVARVL